jgi:hypothetical protein
MGRWSRELLLNACIFLVLWSCTDSRRHRSGKGMHCIIHRSALQWLSLVECILIPMISLVVNYECIGDFSLRNVFSLCNSIRAISYLAGNTDKSGIVACLFYFFLRSLEATFVVIAGASRLRCKRKARSLP